MHREGTDFPRYRLPRNSRVVPWYNAEQFRKVHEYLFSNELKKKRWAVDQISVWETRCHPSLPVAIEATSVITRAIIQDILTVNDSTLSQESDVQMMYAMALVRFVNLTIEPHQKLMHASGARIAKFLGIPSWVVDLRNEATHSFFPAVPSLRKAADCALKYLNESYWQKELSIIAKMEENNGEKESIRDSICQVVKVQFRILKMRGRYSGSDKQKQDIAELNEKLGTLAVTMEKNPDMFIKVLVLNGHFIPLDEELKKLMTKDEYSEYEGTEVSDAVSDADADVDARPSLIPAVPVELEILWKKVLNLMHSMGLLNDFLEALLKYEGERSDIGEKLAVAWAIKILKIFSYGDCYEETPLKKVFTKKMNWVNWKTMLHAAISRPNIYTPYLFPIIFPNLNLNRHATQRILDLMAISLGHANWKSHVLPSDYSIQTVDTLKHKMHLQNAQRKQKEQSKEKKNPEENLFSLYENDDFSSWPIGLILNPVDDDDDDDIQEGIEDELIVEFGERMHYRERYFFGNENDMDENCFEDRKNPVLSDEEEIDLSVDRKSFLYKNK